MRIKWAMAVSKPEFWEDLIKEGWMMEWFGLAKYRINGVEDVLCKETGQKAYFVEVESNLIQYLRFFYYLEIKNKKHMIVNSWISEKGVIRT